MITTASPAPLTLQYQPDSPMLKSDLTEQRILQAVGEQLDQRGLRPVATGSKPDLWVQTYLIVANRQEQVVTNYGYGGPWGGPWGGYWGGPWDGPWGLRCTTKPAMLCIKWARCKLT